MTERIGSYEKFEIIGEGGMATVYRGRDPRFDRPVAVKVLDAKLARNPGLVERFKAEAVIQAKLSHPHVVTVFDFIADGTVLAMIMEYVDGKSLSRVVEEQQGPVPLARVIPLVVQVLHAMEYAHEQGLVHRDIKPSNVLVQRRSSSEFAKVMDFGIAKVLGTEKFGTATSSRMGTLAYMSPEQVRSPKYVDQRSDIYSLGVMLYELSTGRVPFDADSDFEVQRRIVYEPPADPRTYVPDLPPGLLAVIEKSMAKDPGARFQSCAVFRDALGRVVLGEPGKERARDGREGQEEERARMEREKCAREAAEIRARAEREEKERREEEARILAAREARERDDAERRSREVAAAVDQKRQEETWRAEAAIRQENTREEVLLSTNFWIDPATRLMWAKRDNGCDVNWHQAKQYCKSLTLAGYSDWRLPTMGQLEELYDKSRGENERYIKSPLTLTGWWCWSSEMLDTSSTWFFDFSNGKRISGDPGYSRLKRALCVRGPIR